VMYFFWYAIDILLHFCVYTLLTINGVILFC